MVGDRRNLLANLEKIPGMSFTSLGDVVIWFDQRLMDWIAATIMLV